ncbi:hypothetical protein [Microcystis phage Mel-JY34]
MDNKAFSIIFEEAVSELRRLGAIKGGEYAVDSDRLSNFKTNAERQGLHPLQVWGVYAGKHIDAINTFVRDAAAGRSRPRSESIEGRAHDLALYAILFIALVRELEGKGDAASAMVGHLIWEESHKDCSQ